MVDKIGRSTCPTKRTCPCTNHFASAHSTTGNRRNDIKVWHGNCSNVQENILCEIKPEILNEASQDQIFNMRHTYCTLRGGDGKAARRCTQAGVRRRISWGPPPAGAAPHQHTGSSLRPTSDRRLGCCLARLWKGSSLRRRNPPAGWQAFRVSSKAHGSLTAQNNNN